jgi:Leucine-rich repeat (LRR) protein
MIPVQYIFLLLTSFCLLFFFNHAQETPCPFSSECGCIGLNPAGTEFELAVCRPKQPFIPTFNSPAGTYTIKQSLGITRGADNIRPRAFIAFKSINALILEQDNSPAPLKAQWNFEAFLGPQINGFSIRRLAGVIPPPNELKTLGTRGLKSLSFLECRENVELTANVFQDFASLQELTIADTPISNIHAMAFAGLGSLTSLSLRNAKLASFPGDALSRLTKLSSLDLSDNKMWYFPRGAFSMFTSLTKLDLSGSDFNAYAATAFDNLPRSVDTLILKKSGLTSVPSQILRQNGQI